MQFPSLTALKAELKHLSDKEFIALIADLSKFSRENKAFLFFKLYEKDNPRLFVEMVQEELEKEFQLANTKNYHFAKKAAQSIRRKLNKHLKLTKNKPDQIEVIEYFCRNLEKYGYLSFRHPVIDNLYALQVGKIEKLVTALHEDLQYDYELTIQELKKPIRY
ncbi:hypothetical protein [Lunatibacter salilacus]|uniref:hypothetical protein n=1 Tax=Lunatibacter salilacus TaxID=2483804 RepID=UPI00131C4D95|nr:hypothetical protein [Lunatibacter salilacus]